MGLLYANFLCVLVVVIVIIFNFKHEKQQSVDSTVHGLQPNFGKNG